MTKISTDILIWGHLPKDIIEVDCNSYASLGGAVYYGGRTGRGDTAFISYLGTRITKNPEQSLKFAAALTSLKLETPGSYNLPLHQVGNLIKEKY